MAKKDRDVNRAERAAQLRAEQARKERNRNLAIGGAVFVVLALIIAGVVWGIQSQSKDSGPVVAPKNAKDYTVSYGNPNAKLKIKIYEDFQCPVCKVVEDELAPELEKRIAKNDIYVQYQPVSILNEYSVNAQNAWATVLNYQGKDAAMDFHRLLYQNQPKESGGQPGNEDLLKGIKNPTSEMREAVTGLKFKQWIADGTDAASKDDISATPTIFINDKQVGKDAQNIQEVVDEVKKALADK